VHNTSHVLSILICQVSPIWVSKLIDMRISKMLVSNTFFSKTGPISNGFIIIIPARNPNILVHEVRLVIIVLNDLFYFIVCQHFSTFIVDEFYPVFPIPRLFIWGNIILDVVVWNHHFCIWGAPHVLVFGILSVVNMLAHKMSFFFIHTV